jgi:ACS family hexuronate transporter-like MFS transporter
VPEAAPASSQTAGKLQVWLPSLVMLLCSLLSYLDRQTLAVLSPMILRDTGMSIHAYADALSIFSFTYMVSNFFWGAAIPRLGLRTGMLLAVGLWTVASTWHAWVGAFLGFAIARGVLGFGEGATFPGGLQTAATSLPPDKRSRGMAIAYSGSAIGSIVAPLILTPIALHWTWRAAFIATGILGVIWLGLWWAIARPPWLAASLAERHTPVRLNIFERRFWIVIILFGLGGSALGPVLYLSPIYLNRVLGLSQGRIAATIWIPALGWGLGYYFWGWFADRYVRDRRRPALVMLLLGAMALPLALVTISRSWMMAIGLFTWAMFIAVAFIVLSLHLGSKSYPREQSGLVAGIGSGAWSAVVVAILPVYGRWFERKWYGATFLSLALMPLAGVLLWLWLTHSAKQNESTN